MLISGATARPIAPCFSSVPAALSVAMPPISIAGRMTKEPRRMPAGANGIRFGKRRRADWRMRSRGDRPGKRDADRRARNRPGKRRPDGRIDQRGARLVLPDPGIVEELVLRLLARPQQEIDAGRIDGLRRRRARRRDHGQSENTGEEALAQHDDPGAVRGYPPSKAPRLTTGKGTRLITSFSEPLPKLRGACR